MVPVSSRKWWIGGAAAAALIIAVFATYLIRTRADDGPPAATPSPEATPAGAGPLTSDRLPGSGWTTTETELVGVFDSPDPVFLATPDLPECAGIKALESALYANGETLAHGTRSQFVRSLDGGGQVKLTRLGLTFASPGPVESILREARRHLAGADFSNCMLAATAAQGIEASVEDGPPLAIPSGGFGRVLRYHEAANSGGGELTHAFAWWANDDRLMILSIAVAGEGISDADLMEMARVATEASP